MNPPLLRTNPFSPQLPIQQVRGLFIWWSCSREISLIYCPSLEWSERIVQLSIRLKSDMYFTLRFELTFCGWYRCCLCHPFPSAALSGYPEDSAAWWRRSTFDFRQWSCRFRRSRSIGVRYCRVRGESRLESSRLDWRNCESWCLHYYHLDLNKHKDKPGMYVESGWENLREETACNACA